MDSNTHDHRADFVLRRCDGSDVRLHPTKAGKQPVPVYGSLADWTAAANGRTPTAEALAAPQGGGSLVPVRENNVASYTVLILGMIIFSK